MKVVQFTRGLVAISALLVLAASSSAGMILSGAEYGGSPGLGSVSVPIVSTINVDNDDITSPISGTDNNIAVPIKRFDSAGYIDIEFLVSDTSGTTEYKVFESVDNNTGTDWSGYTMELGTGVGAGFVQGTVIGLDFDAPLYTPVGPSSTAFGSVAISAVGDTLTFSSGIHSTGSQTFEFRIDVPNMPLGSFTIRQTPIPVPEPTACFLGLMGMTGLAFVRRRR